MIEPVEDPFDLRLDDYRHVRERDLVGRKRLFIAEGVVVLEKLVRAGRHPIRSVLVAANRAPTLEPLLAALPSSVAVFIAGQAVMDSVVGFAIHRGVLAVGERHERDPATLLGGLPEQALVVGLSAIANHDNMGGLFRNAAAFGADAVVLDAACCDPLYRKAIRVSVGAALTVPFARLAPGEDLAEVLNGAGFETLALSPAGSETLQSLTGAPRQAALFGAEGPGLASSTMARARTVRIPMVDGFDSLNVATASGIVLHRLSELRNRHA